MLAPAVRPPHRCRMKTHIAVVALAFGVSHASAQSNSVDRQIVAARDTVWRAWFTNDTALLRRSIPPAAATYEGTRWNDRKDIVNGARGFAASKARLVDVK